MAIKNPTTASSCDVTHPKDLDSSTDPDPRGVPARADGLRPPDRGRGGLYPLRAAAAGHRAAGPPTPTRHSKNPLKEKLMRLNCH